MQRRIFERALRIFRPLDVISSSSSPPRREVVHLVSTLGLAQQHVQDLAAAEAGASGPAVLRGLGCIRPLDDRECT